MWSPGYRLGVSMFSSTTRSLSNSAIKKSIPLDFFSLEECKRGSMLSCFSKPVRCRTYSS
ncbi:hypothetical protein HanPSC8_Chr06g0239861 [Helianthus annuus]|nr:hypothetical protein HanPSC8_Chr06g0239861 [Helianthus annuus]